MPSFIKVQLAEQSVINAAAIASHQAEFLVSLYRMAYSDFDTRPSPLDYPICSKATWQAICEIAMKIDRRLHPNALPGGLWLNSGFTCHHPESEKLALWEVLVPALAPKPEPIPA